MYGPVAGANRLGSGLGVPAGTTSANGRASLNRNSESGAVRWNVTVPVLSSVTIPADRSQVAASFAQAEPPTMTWK